MVDIRKRILEILETSNREWVFHGVFNEDGFIPIDELNTKIGGVAVLERDETEAIDQLEKLFNEMAKGE